MRRHRVEDVDERRAAEDQRHHVGRRAAGAEREDDADGAERPERAGDRRRGGAGGGEPAQALALCEQRDHRNDDADEEVGHADAQQRPHRAAEPDLPLVQHRTIDAPRQHCSRNKR